MEVKYHKCEKLNQANEFSGDVEIEIYSIADHWYCRIDEDDEVKEQEIHYCIYCGKKLNQEDTD